MTGHTVWSEEKLLQLARELPDDQLTAQYVQNNYGIAPIVMAYRKFGGWRQVVEAVGRKYPGRYQWRTKRYRQNPELFTTELPAVPKAKLVSTHGFCKEQKLERPVVVNQHPCVRCQNFYVPQNRKYCPACRAVVVKEQTRLRIKRWLDRRKNSNTPGRL